MTDGEDEPLGDVEVWGRSDTPLGSADTLLLDTTGELPAWYPLATVAFIGKSLNAIGGQNPAEAISAGVPVVVGPHMENFTDLVSALRSADAIVQIPDTDALPREDVALLQPVADEGSNDGDSGDGAERLPPRLPRPDPLTDASISTMVYPTEMDEERLQLTRFGKSTPPRLLPTPRPLLIPLLLLNLPLHQPNPLILPPPTRLVHMELAAPSSRRRTLHVGDDLWRRRQGRGRLLRAGGREFYLFGGVAEEGGDLGGLFGLRADGTALYGALAAFICACGDGFGAGFGHFGGDHSLYKRGDTSQFKTL